MTALITFGSILAYLLVGLFLSRAVYRHRMKGAPPSGAGYFYVTREFYDTDTRWAAGLALAFWPLHVPVYAALNHDWTPVTRAVARFYNHNLPQSHAEQAQRIKELERELGI